MYNDKLFKFTENNHIYTYITPSTSTSLMKTLNEDTEKLKCSSKLQDWVKLNVGGKIFTTSRSTLVTNEPTSMLAR